MTCWNCAIACLQGEMDALPMIDSALSYSPATSSVMASLDEDDMTLEAKQCLFALKEGKRSVACEASHVHRHMHAYTSTFIHMHTYFDKLSLPCMKLGIVGGSQTNHINTYSPINASVMTLGTAPAMADHCDDSSSTCCLLYTLPDPQELSCPVLPPVHVKM